MTIRSSVGSFMNKDLCGSIGWFLVAMIVKSNQWSFCSAVWSCVVFVELYSRKFKVGGRTGEGRSRVCTFTYFRMRASGFPGRPMAKGALGMIFKHKSRT